jgi:hypothetical protein
LAVRDRFHPDEAIGKGVRCLLWHLADNTTAPAVVDYWVHSGRGVDEAELTLLTQISREAATTAA